MGNTPSFGLPALGPVWTNELRTVLRDLHGLDETEAGKALERGLLIAGYPLDVDFVAAADAFEIIEHGLPLPR
ncbi:hypothetical protein SFC79_07975 [Nocardioides sp. S-58]|uniref:Uncharacterized protein n=1 Tax=Nocardioides renjunii TaxID=3095075 RepID=A0ABU5K9P5_9ACTN|nr:hypothetical protein [Nocardioides sp. S-58]MDZ5661695.1 hypothetical protein [Nocardioides sp. S-58]